MKSHLVQSASRSGHGCNSKTTLSKGQPGDAENCTDVKHAGALTTWLQVKPVYALQDFCRDFGICRSMAYEEIRAGRLRAYKVGASTRIAGEDALAWRDFYRGAKAA